MPIHQASVYRIHERHAVWKHRAKSASAGDDAVHTCDEPAENECNVIAAVAVGYDGDPPSTGVLSIALGSARNFELPFTSGGAGPIAFDPPLVGDPGHQVTITLPGLTGLSGYVNVAEA